MTMPDHVAAVLAKAEAGGVRAAELAALRRRLSQLSERRAGFLPGEVLEPLADLPRLDELPEPPASVALAGRARPAGGRQADGGLGTSMGLSGPKSLLEVKPGTRFLDVIATQVLALRERHGARLPLVLMNSAATRGPAPRWTCCAATTAWVCLACRWTCRAVSPSSVPLTCSQWSEASNLRVTAGAFTAPCALAGFVIGS